MKALVGAFNQEKALIGAFSVVVKTGCGTDGALHSFSPGAGSPASARSRSGCGRGCSGGTRAPSAGLSPLELGWIVSILAWNKMLICSTTA